MSLMKTHNFVLVNCDTDSIMFKLPDESDIQESYQNELLTELNSLYPANIKFEHDGYYKCVIVLKAKNYVLYDGKKIKYKGSAIKSSTLEPALKEFLTRIIESIIFEKYNYKEIYEEYVREILKVNDIKRWASKKTISDKTLFSERTNELKIREAIKGTDYKEGDKIWVYFKSDSSLCLVENYDGDYDKVVLLKKLFIAAKRFSSIIKIEDHFINYSLKKNQKLLENFVEK